MEQNLITFNLESALRGDPVQTGHGVKVKHIVHFPDAKYTMRLAVLFEDNIVRLYPEDGSPVGELDDSWNLFMAPKTRIKKGGWVAVWMGSSEDGIIAGCSHVYATKADVINEGYMDVKAYIRIEWEEDAD